MNRKQREIMAIRRAEARRLEVERLVWVRSPPSMAHDAALPVLVLCPDCYALDAAEKGLHGYTSVAFAAHFNALIEEGRLSMIGFARCGEDPAHTCAARVQMVPGKGCSFWPAVYTVPSSTYENMRSRGFSLTYLRLVASWWRELPSMDPPPGMTNDAYYALLAAAEAEFVQRYPISGEKGQTACHKIARIARRMLKAARASP